MNYADNCLQCAIVEGTGRKQKPLLQPIITERPFQIVGVDVMELPVTTPGNRYAIVFQDLFSMLRKHAAKFGMQWDQYIRGVVWAYRNTPHSSTGEKLSFLLFGFDCHSPSEAAFVPARTKSLRA